MVALLYKYYIRSITPYSVIARSVGIHAKRNPKVALEKFFFYSPSACT